MKNNKEVNKGWRLDYFVLDRDHQNVLVDSKIHKHFDGSDHVPLQLVIDLSKVTAGDKEEDKDEEESNIKQSEDK